MFFKDVETKDANKSVHKLVTLKKNYQFQYVFRKGHRFNSLYFTLVVASSNKSYSKFGIVISKKVGKAVFRNKKRRQIKEILRANLNYIKVNQYVILAKDTIEKATFEQIKADILGLFKNNKFMEQ